MRFLLLFSALSLCGQECPRSSPYSACAGWQSLSQLDSLMPERIWEEEFQIFVDPALFASSQTTTPSRSYFLKSAMSKDPVALTDPYPEFLWSPYWKYPKEEVSAR